MGLTSVLYDNPIIEDDGVVIGTLVDMVRNDIDIKLSGRDLLFDELSEAGPLPSGFEEFYRDYDDTASDNDIREALVIERSFESRVGYRPLYASLV